MARVAVVTGGTRGIGHAISIALKNKGFRVAATYAGNDAAARQFQAETGIPDLQVGRRRLCRLREGRDAGSPATWDRSMCSSTMPASRATACCTG